MVKMTYIHRFSRQLMMFLLVNKKSNIFAEEEGGEVKFRYFKTKLQNRLPDPLYAVQCHSPNKKCFDKASEFQDQ